MTDSTRDSLLTRADELIKIIESYGETVSLDVCKVGEWGEDTALIDELGLTIFYLTRDCDNWVVNQKTMPAWAIRWERDAMDWQESVGCY